MLSAATGRHHRTHCKTPAERCRRAGCQLKAPGCPVRFTTFCMGRPRLRTQTAAKGDAFLRIQPPSRPIKQSRLTREPIRMSYVVPRASHISDTRIPP